jgi:membrane fusion protein (multidrug efflux system)
VRRPLLVALALLTIAGALGYGAWAWWRARTFVSTDDAYVEGAVSPVSAKIAGHVVELLVDDNRPVRKGDLLVRIDPRDYQARREQAQAGVAMAEAAARAARADIAFARGETRAEIQQARAALDAALVAVRASESAVEEARARVEARRAAVEAARAEVTGAQSASRRAGRELERVKRLLGDGLVAQREFDLAESDYHTAEATAEAQRRRVSAADKEAEQAVAELGARRSAVEHARERVAEARAALARAESRVHQVEVKEAEARRAEARLKEAEADAAVAGLQVEHTEVRAAVDGIVSKRTVELGQVVQPGQPLMAIVPLHEVWVVANFKETQLERVRAGMPAEITVDSYTGKRYTGVVESISAGTGARFSLLPPENATGNWVKVVQRVPVKIRLSSPAVDNPHTLRAGMSAVVTIRVR